MSITKKVLTEFAALAEKCYPQEACALVIQNGRKLEMIPCINTAPNPTQQFRISAEEYAEAEERGEIVRVLHSHPGEDATSMPSPLYRDLCNETGVTWGIMSWPGADYAEITPINEPLRGRRFQLGSHDCGGLVIAFHRLYGITFKDFRKPYEWWEKGEDIFTPEGFEATGFVDSPLIPGALILMQIQSSVPNHCGIYTRDGRLLHHMTGALSSAERYHDSYYQGRTVRVMRHKDLPNPEDLNKWD